MTGLSVTVRPEDMAWAIARRDKRGHWLGAGGAMLLLNRLVLLLGAMAALRLGYLAMRGLATPEVLWGPLSQLELVLAGSLLAATLVQLVVTRALMGTLVAVPLRASAATEREPLAGPLTARLLPDAVECEGTDWRFRRDAALLTRLEETPALLVLWMGLASPVVLPRRDLTAEQARAVRDWADGVLARRGGRPGTGTMPMA